LISRQTFSLPLFSFFEEAAMNIAVIGSGLAGLTAGAALAQAGHKVTVYEQAARAGGVTAPIEQDGYRWDLGQLLIEGLGADEPLGQILTQLKVLDKIRVRKDDRRYVFPDFALDKPKIYSGLLWRLDRLKEIFPKEARGLKHYWKDNLRFTRIMTCARHMESASGLKKLLWQARLYANLLPFLPRKDWSAQRLMDSYFKDNRLKAVFLSILADFFTPPSQFIGLGVFALNPEASFDCRMPKELGNGAEQLYHYSVLGGISTLVDALVEAIHEAGGQVLTNTPVKKILIQQGQVSGVETAAGTTSQQDAVIATGAAKETFFNLVGKEYLPDAFITRINTLPLMDSVFMVHLGLDYDPGSAIPGACTYFYGTYDLETGIQRAHDGFYHGGEDGFVTHLPTRHTPGMAPPGRHALTIYTICPDRLKEGSWEDGKEAYADHLVACAEKYLPGLREHTCTRVIVTPEDFRARVHAAHHAFGGLAPFKDAQRIPHQTPIKGLWFAGSQSESGGGINNVIPAAFKLARRF
jgi:all-trans-retinol 13,14-reductase